MKVDNPDPENYTNSFNCEYVMSSPLEKFEILTHDHFQNLEKRFIETALSTGKEKDIDIFNIMTKQGIRFNEYQFIELFLNGRMLGRTTLEVFTIIKLILGNEKGHEETITFSDPHGVKMAHHKMDLLTKYITHHFQNYISITGRNKRQRTMRLKRL